ncbi:MAG: protein kinase [Candidatus Competibacteraceae bacterium]|nr:protein kinase [Candidatus Competibacteraceae bacterium]
MIHRDIKPANILVRPDYTLILTDFGIAHVGGSELTQTGDLLGSPLHMAPEQLRGEPVDGRADLFAAGVVLYYLLTQRKPFYRRHPGGPDAPGSVRGTAAALNHQPGITGPHSMRYCAGRWTKTAKRDSAMPSTLRQRCAEQN